MVIAAVLTLCLGAGLVGGVGFPLDVAVVRHFETVRASAPELTLAAIAITQAGSAWATLGSGASVAAWLAWHGQRRLAAVLGATVIGERIAIDGLKLLIDRARPTLGLHPVETHSSSFPSGHAGNSMAIYLAIALIASPRKYRLAAVVCAFIASLIIGATRPFLGVHWPSDVVGGWALGAAIAITSWSIAEARQVNRDEATPSDYSPASRDVRSKQGRARPPLP